ncbi:MAG: DUF2012 domain-containing protein [candidate division KSB1 bacterium]|nr:DUF2012 domain-containing protein [candidate division KSB1 bacterium]
MKVLTLTVLILLLCTLLPLQAQQKDSSDEIDLRQYAGLLMPSGMQKKIAVNFKNETFEDALSIISREADMMINYNRDDLPLDSKISLEMYDVLALEAIVNVLKKTNTALHFTSAGQVAIVPAADAPAGRSRRGTVKGKVADASSGEPLPGANVVIDGTSIGAATDIDGEYVIRNVKPGSYTLEIRYIGYKNASYEIKVESDETLVRDARLSYASVQTEEVHVTAQREGQLEAINKQLSSRSIRNVVASDRIQEIPDANAAESLGRLPGINVLRSGGEGTKVSIRGMTPKFNTVKLNNVAIPSTDTDNRSVDLTMISPNMLSEIEVIKSLTPDQDADAIGGVVNLRLKEAEPGLHTDILVQGGYNEKMQSYKPYKIQASISNRFFNDKLGVSLQGNLERADRGTHLLDVDWEIVKEMGLGESPLEMDVFKLQDREDIRKRYGASIIMDYQMPNGQLQFNSIYTQWNRDRLDRTEEFRFSVVEHHWDVKGEEHEINTFTHSLQGENDFSFMIVDYGLAYTTSNRNHPRDLSLNFIELSAFDRGYSSLLTKGPKALFGFARNDYEEAYVKDLDIWQTEMHDNNFQANLDFTIPMQVGSFLSGDFRFGGKYTSKDRFYDTNRWLGPMDWDLSLLTDETRDYLHSIGWGAGNLQPPFFFPLLMDKDYDEGDFLGVSV